MKHQQQNHRHQRPQRFSDPCNDFTPGYLRKLLDNSDGEMAWNDYRDILGPHLPAGTYEETAYFLPFAFDYLEVEEEDTLELIYPVFGYIAKNRQNLEADNLFEHYTQRIETCLTTWTATFQIKHFDAAACRAKGWQMDHYDIVERTEETLETLNTLVQHKTHESLAVDFVTDLATSETNITKAAWLLELSHEYSNHYTPALRKQKNIDSLLTDQKRLDRAATTVASQLSDYSDHLTYLAQHLL